MDNHSLDKKGLKRRKLLPLIMGSFFLPYLGFGNGPNQETNTSPEDNEIYDTFLKADGSIVKIKRKATRDAKVIQKKVSNKSLLNWLGKSNS
ncbi:hypothetical protein [Robiginitalea sp. IMCC43444]|uniref:hypothetical protein n=1 Tax=Robiginitalea sp. IMCC43444 TaxID=3459121 RepID=UPI0040414E17